MIPGLQAFIGIMGIWLILAVFGNACVVLVVYRNKKMRTVTNIFICNLAISDIFLAAFVLPQNIHDMSHIGDFFEGKSNFQSIESALVHTLHIQQNFPCHFDFNIVLVILC